MEPVYNHFCQSLRLEVGCSKTCQTSSSNAVERGGNLTTLVEPSSEWQTCVSIFGRHRALSFGVIAPFVIRPRVQHSPHVVPLSIRLSGVIFHYQIEVGFLRYIGPFCWSINFTSALKRICSVLGSAILKFISGTKLLIAVYLNFFILHKDVFGGWCTHYKRTHLYILLMMTF